MSISLIPVLEIVMFNEDISSPENGPYWEYPDEWDKCHTARLRAAGLTGDIIPISRGCSFYKTDSLTDKDIATVINSYINKMKEMEMEDFMPLSGGYVLTIDGQHHLYPQCCSDLGDFYSWNDLLEEGEFFYAGHPAPKVSYEVEAIIFDFTDIENESFSPPPLVDKLRINKQQLKEAVQELNREMDAFCIRLEGINRKYPLNIDSVKALVYGE